MAGVSKEYATLLAQVIPVLALALGLEVRAIVARMTRRADAEEPISPYRAGALTGALGVALAFLAGIEIRALYIVAESDQFWPNMAFVPLATAVVFLAPIPGAIYAGMQTGAVTSTRAAASTAVGMVVLSGVVFYAFFSF
jgi:hypothetical protein